MASQTIKKIEIELTKSCKKIKIVIETTVSMLIQL